MSEPFKGRPRVFRDPIHGDLAVPERLAWTVSRMLAAIQRNSCISLSEEEYDDTVIAALLHDVGHGPFSHALEEIRSDLRHFANSEGISV